MARGLFVRAEEREEIRRRIVAGEQRSEIASALGRSIGTVGSVIRQASGRPPRRVQRSPRRLSLAEREEISRGLQAGESLRMIGRRLGRAASTVSREVANHGRRPAYRAWRAERMAVQAARRLKPAKLATNHYLRAVVEALLA